MAETQKSSGSVPVCLTPLYHFSSDAPELVIGPGIRTCRYEDYGGITFDEVIAKHLQVHEPAYVDTRKEIFLDVKKFYNLRSKLVHGVQLDAKLLNQLNELDLLRETLRRVLLSVMALLSEEECLELTEFLDELAFDNEKRKQVQAKASKFLHISAESPSS